MMLWEHRDRFTTLKSDGARNIRGYTFREDINTQTGEPDYLKRKQAETKR